LLLGGGSRRGGRPNSLPEEQCRGRQTKGASVDARPPPPRIENNGTMELDRFLRVLLFGERSLRRALDEYTDRYHGERNHHGKGKVLRFPRNRDIDRKRPVQCRERLGGFLRYYHQEVA